MSAGADASPLTVPRGPCPTAEQLIRAASGELGPEERQRIARHATQCTACGPIWRAAGGREEAPAPAAAAAPAKRKRRLSPLALALILGLAGVAILAALVLRLAVTSARKWTRPAATASGRPGAPTTTSASRIPILGRPLDELRSSLDTIHAANEKFRQELKKPPATGGRLTATPLPSTKTATAPTVIMREPGSAFAVAVQFPPGGGVTRLAVVDSSGKTLWQRPVRGGERTTRIRFPAGAIAAGSYVVRAIDGEGVTAADYPFVVSQ